VLADGGIEGRTFRRFARILGAARACVGRFPPEGPVEVAPLAVGLDSEVSDD
jgi:hypothetical protein